MIPQSYVYKKASVRAAVRLYDRIGWALWRRRGPKNPPPPRRILIAVLHQIGDVVMCLPSIGAIHNIFPRAKLTIMAGHGPAGILATNPWQANIVAFDAAWQKVVRHLSGATRVPTDPKADFERIVAAAKPDLIVAFHPDMIVNQLLGRTNALTTIAFANAGGGFALTHPVDMPSFGHQTDRNYALVETVAKAYHRHAPSRRRLDLICPPTSKVDMGQRLRNAAISRQKLVVIHPFASAETKNWPMRHWQPLIAALVEQSWQPVVIGGQTDQLPFSLPTGAHDWTGSLKLTDTVGLIVLARLFIGVDSGPGHIAAAVGTRLISIFSSVHDPDRWAPLGEPKTTAILHQLAGDRRRYPREQRRLPAGESDNPYLAGVTVDDVLRAVKRLTDN